MDWLCAIKMYDTKYPSVRAGHNHTFQKCIKCKTQGVGYNVLFEENIVDVELQPSL